MYKIIIFVVMILFSAGLCFAQGTDDITLTTYYPSPYGVYTQMRLYPTDSIDPVIDNCSAKGTMYFDDSDSQIYICDGLNWQRMGIGGVWTSLGGDIYNINAGKVGMGTGASLTSDADYRLEVEGACILLDNDEALGSNRATVAGTAKMIFMNPNDDTYLNAPAGQSIYFSQGGVGNEVMTIGPTGNVGIGTANPGAKFVVADSDDFEFKANYEQAGIDSYITFKIEAGEQTIDASRFLYILTGDGHTWEDPNLILKHDAGTGVFDTLAVGDNYAQEAGLPTNSLCVEGSMGIGTTDPQSYKLYVEGKIHMEESSGTGSKNVYGDIAEDIFAPDVSTGDVVVIDFDNDQRVIRSSSNYATNVAGIISHSPGFLIGKDGEDDYKPLALAGRVYCKVTTENGSIKRGDLLVTSSKPGYAMKADSDKLRPGMLLGKALEPWVEGEGKVMVLITAK